jgi:CO/xanthine dehydrogenase FAD-binding subunit
MILHQPTSKEEALAILADQEQAIPVAGGTDLFPHWPTRPGQHDRTYLDLSGIKALRPMTWTANELVLGAMTTFWDAITSPDVAREFPLMVRAARQVGAVQIQTRGTWAGNVINASPAGDGVAALMACDATLVLESARGREEIPLHRFFTGYKKMKREKDQLVVAIRIPRRQYDDVRFEKVGQRRAQVITKMGLAVTRRGREWRVVAASMAPAVCRCPAVERVLGESTITSPDDLSAAIAQDVAPVDDLRSTAEYRRRVMARVLFDWFGQGTGDRGPGDARAG